MRFNSDFKAYAVTVKMREGAQFKFVVDGKYITSTDYPHISVHRMAASHNRQARASRTTCFVWPTDPKKNKPDFTFSQIIHI
jgi:hypothetical protein